jgi:hypothetical protein
MSEDEGKPTPGLELTTEHEVKIADGWAQVIEGKGGQLFIVQGPGDQWYLPSWVEYIARKAPKPDPIQERYKLAGSVVQRILDKYHVASWQLTQELAGCIANGEADL